MYAVTVLTQLCIYAILTLSLNLVTGLAGQVSLGHAAFFGLGAYTVGVLTTRGFPFLTAWLLAAVVAAGWGLLLGSISLRLREDFLAIASIAFNFVVVAALLYLPYFGGAYGISGIPKPMGSVAFSVLVLATTLGVAWCHERLRRSDLGLAWMSLRESEAAAEALGVDVRRFKVTAFVLGTGLAGVAGGLYAAYIGVIRPEDFGFPLSVTLLAMVAVGGMGTMWGPLAGAFLLGGFAQAFAFVHNYQLVLYGLLLAVVMRYRPQGLLGRRPT
ncbi:MAG: branched-chain amino acid ABC transporter permease [candidate division GAL15 bacterium]